jgi:hypothetical protein
MAFFDGLDVAARIGADQDLLRFWNADRGKLLQWRRRAVILNHQVLDECRRGAPGADRHQIVTQRFDRLIHAVFGVGNDFV